MSLSKFTTVNIESSKELEEYLRRVGRLEPSQEVTTQVLSGGVSNRTVLVTKSNGERWIMKQALEKLRVAEEWYSSPLRIHREALGMRWLAELTPANTVPRLIFEDRQQHLLAMQAVPEPCQNWKELLLAGNIQLDWVRQFGDILGTIHKLSTQRREEFGELFAETQFFESLRLEPYYEYTGRRLGEARQFYQQLIHDTRRQRLTLVHGDYSPKNILVSRDRLILIDHEVIHFGDPAFDLGFSMTHLLSKYHHLEQYRPILAESVNAFWQAYQSAVGGVEWLSELQPRAVRHTLGCLLARACGRSPLEYLNEAERNRQAIMVLDLMKAVPETIEELCAAWQECCNRRRE